MALPIYCLAFVFIMTFICFVRLLYILPAVNPSRPPPRRRGSPTHLLIVLGSGGHTAEMLSLLEDLDTTSYTHRTYIISSGDDFSARKAVDFEEQLATRSGSDKLDEKNVIIPSSYSLHLVPRARKVHQSLLSAPLSSLQCFIACILFLNSGTSSSAFRNNYPDLILINGPATSVLVLLAALFLRFFALPGTNGKMRSIYVESWARVKALSLSGKILVGIGAVDRVLVQWEGLAKESRLEYLRRM